MRPWDLPVAVLMLMGSFAFVEAMATVLETMARHA
jgi:hypothetical protein